MTQLAAEAYHRAMERVANDPRMREDNITVSTDRAASIQRTLMGVGAGCLALAAAGGFIHGWRHAMASYLVGVGVVLSMSLGALILTMIFHLVNAGWCATIRRQFENLASMLPIAAALMIPLIAAEVFTGGELYGWMDDSTRQSDVLLQAKAPYLNVGFFLIRAVLYSGLWTFLSRRLLSLSREQDRTGDRFLSNKARFMCSWGLPLTALSVAFAGFDWFMSLEHHFFSTMWGVYIFAGGALSCMAVMVLTFAVLRLVGRLNGLVTVEHFHDMGKMLFAFTVFWAYIAFSQYFLIWYSNIPEETFYLLRRTTGEWMGLGVFLAVGHFIVPFLFMLSRTVKRTPRLLVLGALWVIFAHVLDYVWIVRPVVYAPGEAPGPAAWWLDAAAIVGVMSVFAGVFVGKLGAGPLTPLKDPRLPKAMAHVNYV